MRIEVEEFIRKRKSEIENYKRYNCATATVLEHARLALIQLEIDTEMRVLKNIEELLKL